jgi:transposase-like protein
MNCNIVPVGRRRDGGTRYWCVAHHANATAKYGKPATKCVAADDTQVGPEESLDLDLSAYLGGIALWGSVPAVYDTTEKSADRGIHVHARAIKGGEKVIDRTYRKLRIPLTKDLISDGWAEVDEIDAINFMVSSVFGFETITVNCPHCGFAHLDRDWFAVHPHRRHQCHGCGKQFSDSTVGIGNPLATLREMLRLPKAKLKPARKKALIKQTDFPGGLQIWGSNPAIMWTADRDEEDGIHVHAFANVHEELPSGLDDTFAEVVIDGISLNAVHTRTYMAQSAMPHLEGRVVGLNCPKCGEPHFDVDELAFTPHIDHICASCGTRFTARGQMKKTIGNPFVGVREKLAGNAPNPLRSDKLGLRPETI